MLLRQVRVRPALLSAGPARRAPRPQGVRLRHSAAGEAVDQADLHLSEKQFHLFFERADHQKGITGTNLLVALERRLDNVVYRLGFANSRTQARQLVQHSHFTVNGRKVNIPSFQVKVGDAVEVRERSRKIQLIQDSLDAVVRRGIPQWLDLEKENLKGMIKSLPVREDLTMPMQEQLVVELYSK